MSCDRESLLKFIEAYKNNQCLWDVNHKDYLNRGKRLDALTELIPFLGEDATINTVRKKIEIFRNGYFRQLKKVRSSTDSTFVPTLWYYNLFTFLGPDENCVATTNECSMDTTSAGISNSCRMTRKTRSTYSEEEFFKPVNKLLSEIDEKEEKNAEDDILDIPENGRKRRIQPRRHFRDEFVDQITRTSESTCTSDDDATRDFLGGARKVQRTNFQEGFLNSANKFTTPVIKATSTTEKGIKIKEPTTTNVTEEPKTLVIDESTEKDNDESFGIYLGRQLQRLTRTQRIFAEKLMSDILYLARTSQLNQNCQIITLLQQPK